VSLHDNFFALGGDSLLAMGACVEIEKRLHRRISPSVLYGAPNLARLADAIARGQSLEGAVVIVPLRTSGRCQPLFLMPKITGSPWIARNLLECLDADRPVFALGLADENAPWGEQVTLREIATHCVAALREAKVEGPVHLMGRSFGGILAYEVARQLQEAGVEVGCVAVVDAWLELREKSRWSTLRNVPFFFGNLPRWLFQFVFKRSRGRQIYAIRLRLRGWKNRIRQTLTGRRTIKRLDWSMGKQKLPEPVRKRMDTYFYALQAYVPGPYCGDIVLFRAKTRPLLHGLTPDLNWRHFVSGGVEIVGVSGNHESLFKSPNNQLIADRLQALLEAD
jgi:thioesterase domain-containing protein